jgi:hypothetical protein
MGVRIAWSVVALIILGAVVSALFRVATAPDRIQARKDTAREVCVKSGGEWVVAGRDELCKKG